MSLPATSARPPRGWRYTALALALTGIAIGVSLTRMKVRQIGTPCLAPSAGCPLGEHATCGDVLASPWSMLFGEPLSLWATAFYMVLAVLLCLRARALASCVPHLLLALAIVDVLVSLVMASYSGLVLGTFCTYCLALYTVSLLVLICVDGIYRGLRHQGLMPWRVAWRQPGARLDVFFVAGMLFISAAGVQMIAAKLWLAAADSSEGCPKLRTIPRTDLVFGARDPDVLLLAFVDPSCNSCKQKYEDIVELHNTGALGRTQIRVVLFPRQACDESSFPGGFPNTADAARSDNACLAALAILCAERVQPGRGIPMLGHLYALRDHTTASPLFDRASISAAAGDADVAAPELLACIDDVADRTALDSIAAAQSWLFDLWEDIPEERWQIPVIMLIPVQGGIPELADVQYVPANASGRRIVRQLDDLRAEQSS